MVEKYAPLMQPLSVGKIELKNRVAMAPMGNTNIIGIMGGINKGVHDYYIERAQSGVGLITPGFLPVYKIVGDGYYYQDKRMRKPLLSMMDEMHSYGTKVFMQFGAGWGRAMFVNPAMWKAMKLMPSLKNKIFTAPDDDEPSVWLPDLKMRGVSKEEIRDMVYAFGQTAKVMQDCGVDGIEIHAVHEGYLLDQFATPYTNHRTDEYGGSMENRYRFAIEIIQEMKKQAPDFPVSLRYSVTSKTKGYNQGAVPGEAFEEAGRTLEESEQAIRMLSDAGYDMFSCDNGTYDAWYWAHPPVYMPLNCNLKEVKHIKKFTDKPVFCAGRMEMDTAAEEIANHGIDGVAVARQTLCDPEFLHKLLNGQEEDIRPCIACHAGCFATGTYKDAGAVLDPNMAKCALNPRTRNEKKYTVVPAKHPKKMAVVGGGIAGMEFAIQASKRGHTVDLYEKSDELGGVFIAAAAPTFKEKDRDLLKYYETQLNKSTVRVHMNKEVKDLHALDADEIIVATGASARRLKMPGAENAVDAIEYLRKTKPVGDKVCVIGGGLTGCEIAYNLVLEGKHPFIVEMLDDLIRMKGVSAANSTCLRDLLRFHKVPVYLESSVKAIGKDKVTIGTKDGDVELAYDSIITSIGYNAGTPLAEESNKHIHLLGDVNQVANLKKAIWDANDLVLKLSK